MTTIVDLRSDTVTQPDEKMRRAMAEAVVGDDVFGEDPSVQALQKQTAELLGKEDALFMPTGTMANLVAVLNHCWGRGTEIIMGDKSHINLYEQGGVAQWGGVHSKVIENLPNGTFDIKEIRAKAYGGYDPHFSQTGLVCIENTHNMMGGKILPMDWLDELGSTCKELKIPIHLDGARLLNAAVVLDLPPARLTNHCDSVSLCLSKGLGAPVGSLLAGTSDFIKRAIRLRKALGGGMRQSGILAAAGSLALAKYQATLRTDHDNAKRIAQAVIDCKSEKVTVTYSGVHTNILMLDCNTDKITPEDLQEKLEKCDGAEDNVSVRTFGVNSTQVRLVTNCNLTTESVAKACQKIINVIKS